MDPMKCAFIIVDGLGNIPGKSPLEEIDLENINYLTKNGRAGHYYSIGKALVPGSDIAHLFIFGYEYEDYPNRGPLEALGANIKLEKNDIAFRANFAIIDKNGVVLDRRAGRISTKKARELEKKIDNLIIDGYRVLFKSTTEHRGVLVIKGNKKNDLNDKITGTDPGKEGLKMLECKAIEKKGKRTAKIVNKLIKKINEILEGEEANTILLRGAGRLKNIEIFENKHNIKAAMIAGGALYKGVARYVGIKANDIEGVSADIKSDYKKKAKEALKERKENDIVFIHLKAPDNYGHDGDKEGKIKAYEKVDEEFIKYIIDEFHTILLTGDHATPYQLKRHSSHGSSIIAYGENVGKDHVRSFNELETMKGSLGILEKHDALNFVKDWISKAKKVGY